MSNEDPVPVAAFLSRHPEQDIAVESYALKDSRSRYGFDAFWDLLCVALAIANSPRVLSLLPRLLSHRDKERGTGLSWRRLTAQHVAALVDYLCARSALDCLRELMPHLTEAQCSDIRIAPTHPAFMEWVQKVRAYDNLHKRVCHELALAICDSVGKPHTANREEWQRNLQAFSQACETIIAPGHKSLVEDVLEPLTLLSLLGTPPSHSVLDNIAGVLSELSDDGVVRAANLLRAVPSPEWIGPLKMVWLRIEKSVRTDPDKPLKSDLEPFLEAAAGAVAAALGACAAADQAHANFTEDEGGKEGEAIDRYNDLVTTYNALVEQYQRGSSTKGVAERIKVLGKEIENQKTQLEDLHEGCSPGYLLWIVFRNGQVYPMAVRQAAAWGLHFMCGSDHVSHETKNRICRAIRDCVAGDERAAFCERSVRLLARRGALELAGAMEDGLRWMCDLVEPDAEPFESRFPNLRATTSLICRLMPNALDFFSRYPLRLMPLDCHLHLLGYYRRNACSLAFWTRYTPPHGKGPVHTRYVTLDDRSTPNSMGVYYWLFRHPVLALPVIYHEFLHYGGPQGNPSQFIHNETETLLREIIFTRYLIAALAPKDDRRLSTFEETLTTEARQLGLESLLAQVGYDLRSNSDLVALNREVLNLYGDPVPVNEIEQRVGLHIVSENRAIELMNYQLDWCPNTKWPTLGTADTRFLSEQYGNILKQHWSRQHNVSPPERDAIIGQPPCLGHLEAWGRYLSRWHGLGSASALQAADRGASNKRVEEIVQRFRPGPAASSERD